MKTNISSIPAISAIYFALLQSGYDFYAMGRDEPHIEAVKAFVSAKDSFPFFDKVRQNTCAVYPYWPRAAMLETASFHLSPCMDFQRFHELKHRIFSATNISEIERNQDFWNWLRDFPCALHEVVHSSSFQTYLKWENDWIKQQNLTFQKDLQEIQNILETCTALYKSETVREVSIVLNPIKCIYSADYHFIDNRFIFCSGRFQKEAIVHEYLHHIVHPVVEGHRVEILDGPASYPDIDDSYYSAGQLNAFEEYFVRCLTDAVMRTSAPSDLHFFVKTVLGTRQP